MRIVSLTCSNTEIVCALGCAEMLVGVDDHSDFPADVVADLPRVGPDLGVDPEKVAALEPDLVLASLTVPGHEKVVAAIEDAGLPYVAPRPQSLADVARDVRDIAVRLGVAERGEEVAASMQEAFDVLRREGEETAALAAGRAPASIMVQWWPKPVIAPGRASWAHDLLELVGATHPLAEEAVESRPLEDEEVAALRPDAFVLAWCGVEPHKVRPDVVRSNPTFGDLPAIREDHVYCVPEAWLGRPSPRLVHGARALREVVAGIAGAPVRPALRDPRLWRQGLDG
ncbi:MAG: cobalamin-binding protein [Acidobacteria bacterium]|nr:MAG: cobalamin-binding protein [Acidobacteriota bacterium]REK00917.1 MAG: cobalamin-binding protein [Acidobacteriota bacterium]